MHSWFTKKLDEMIEFAHYCNFPILQAHLLLSQKSVDTMYQQGDAEDDYWAEVLPLLIYQAKQNGQTDVLGHLERALQAAQSAQENSGKVVTVNFRKHLQNSCKFKIDG